MQIICSLLLHSIIVSWQKKSFPHTICFSSFNNECSFSLSFSLSSLFDWHEQTDSPDQISPSIFMVLQSLILLITHMFCLSRSICHSIWLIEAINQHGSNQMIDEVRLDSLSEWRTETIWTRATRRWSDVCRTSESFVIIKVFCHFIFFASDKSIHAHPRRRREKKGE